MLWDIPQMVTTIGGIVNKLVPDRDIQIKIQSEIEKQLIAVEADQLSGQREINKIEASSPSLFVAGWRPACGWVGAFGLAWQFVIAPMATWIATLAGSHIALPVLPSSDLLNLVFALLGIGGLRSFDKWKGTETRSVK
jgi:hypothetical protein